MVASFEEWLWARHSHAITCWFALSVLSGILISVKMPKHPSCWLQVFMSAITFLSFVYVHWKGKPYKRAHIPMSIANVSVMLITLSLAKSEEEPGANLYFLASSWMDTLSIITALVPTLLFGRFGKLWAVFATLHTIPMIPYYKRMVGYDNLQALGRAIFIHLVCYGVYCLYNTYELRAYSKYCNSSSSSSSQQGEPLKPPTGSDSKESMQSTNDGGGKVSGGFATDCPAPAARAMTAQQQQQYSSTAARAAAAGQPQHGSPPYEHAAAICCDAVANSGTGTIQGVDGPRTHAGEVMEPVEHGRAPLHRRIYRSKTRTIQVAIKISGPISPEDFPCDAADHLMSKINSSFPSARASQPAVRWGCVVLALDIVGVDTDDVHQEQLESHVSNIILQWAAEQRLEGPLTLQVGNRVLRWGPRHSGQSNAQWELREVLPLDTESCSLELPADALCLMPGASAAAEAAALTADVGGLQQHAQQQQAQQQQQGEAPSARVQVHASVAVPSSSQLRAWQGTSTEPEANHVLLLARTQGHFLPVEVVQQHVQQQQQEQQRQAEPGGGPCGQTQHELELAVPLPHELLPRGVTPELLWLELWQGNTALLTSSLAILWPRDCEHTVAELVQVFKESCADRETQVRSFAADLALWLQSRRLQEKAACAEAASANTSANNPAQAHNPNPTTPQTHASSSQALREQHSAETDAGACVGVHQQQQQQQQQEPTAVPLGCQLLHAAVSLGLPTLSETVLQVLLQPPLGCSFADVACISFMRLPDGQPAAVSGSSGLLALALRSHSASMVLKVLAQGECV